MIFVAIFTVMFLLVLQMVPEDHEGWKLTDEGDEYASKGSPEAIVYNLVCQYVYLSLACDHLASFY